MAPQIKPLSENDRTVTDFFIKEIDKKMLQTDGQWNFFNSLKKQWIEKKSLSKKQRDCLEKIYERVTR